MPCVCFLEKKKFDEQDRLDREREREWREKEERGTAAMCLQPRYSNHLKKVCFNVV